ncbi:MAG TPA: sarcosine oxidase subunit delta [Acidimicrobiia bacterium]|nr:sarcosine oxidase subunit delta [Acidimicrobiia bacterium]
MALTIPCAFCGLRSVEEFGYGEVPQVPDDITDPEARDVDRVFMNSNRNGPMPEAWFHAHGCRRWTYLTRDRSTDVWL